MNAKRATLLLVLLLIASVCLAPAQMMKRTDAVWARTVAGGTITLDGMLNEAAWSTADSLHVRMGQDAGIPGSGWVWENGLKPGLDPTHATIKFLAEGDDVYIAIVCRDKSIGGGLFNHFDGLLMNIREALPTGDFAPNPHRGRENQANELFYGWVTEGWADTTTAAIGALPAFLGDFSSAYVHPRPDTLKAIWDAVTTVQGITNTDTLADTSWTTELKINTKEFGYNIGQAGGDVVQYGIQIYDADYQWPLDTLKQSGNRVWVQSPWGNASAYNHLRIFVRPDVTNGPLPPLTEPDVVIPDGKNYAAPTIDGKLDEAVWASAASLQIQYGNAAIREAYPFTAKYRSGQRQPEVNGGKAAVLDPNLATVKFFFKGDTLYLGFDVDDQFVQYTDNFDRWDGFRVTMDQRDARNGDSVLAVRRFAFRVDSLGQNALRAEDLGLGGWDSLMTAVTVDLALKSGTTVDTLGMSPDVGYSAEMAISLQKLGYPAGRGDGVVFLGITHFDGDSFSPASSSYGTRTWFMREGDWDDGAAWMYMDPNVTVDVAENGSQVPAEFALLGNYPNPFNPSTTIKFLIARTSEVTLDVYDVLGRVVSSRSLGVRSPGEHAVAFDAANMATGTYFYRLKMVSNQATLLGKMMLLK